MKILVSGGGTGGHITPILAVAHELKELSPSCRVIYVGERGGKFRSLLDAQPDIDELHTVFSGKFRRYNGESFSRRLFDFSANLRNIRDAFYLLIGVPQALLLLFRVKPNIIFLKGGYVGVPVGIAAAILRIPYITHDSDVLPGLANRITGKWALIHATGMPSDMYSCYSRDSVRYTGVLVAEQYKYATEGLQADYRRELGIPINAIVILVTGGSLGAQRLNTAFRGIESHLFEKYSNLHIIHQVGKGNVVQEMAFSGRLRELEFMDNMYRYTGAATIVVSRAGANTIAELGAQGKACIVVPNPRLTDGHQLKNADYFLSRSAIRVVQEEDLDSDNIGLEAVLIRLIEDPAERTKIGDSLFGLSKSNAAKNLAKLLLDNAKIK